MPVAFAEDCCPVRWSADVGGDGNTEERGKFGCRTHRVERVEVQIFLDEIQRRKKSDGRQFGFKIFIHLSPSLIEMQGYYHVKPWHYI